MDLEVRRDRYVELVLSRDPGVDLIGPSGQ